jgi:hypothetical protein
MSKYQIVLALSWILAAASHVAAEEPLEFTLDEVEASSAPNKRKPAAVDTRQAGTVDPKQAIAQELGELRWGMSKAELIKLLKAQVRAEFEQRVKVERDILSQDALYQEAQDRARRISEKYVAFDGQKTGWDVSPISAEFTHGNREAMLVVSGRNSRDMYFFIQDKLWKWFRELTPDARTGAAPEETLAALEQRFGPGKPQHERRSESNEVYPGTTWTDGRTRITALRRGSESCLVFEDAAKLSQLAVLRHHVQPKMAKDRAAAAVDSILLSEAELEARSR